MAKGIGKSCLVTVFFLISLGAAAYSQRPGSQSFPDMPLDEHARTETINALVHDLKDDYVFPDVGEKMAKMIEQKQAQREYNSISSASRLSELLTSQMYEIAHDRHLHVNYSAEVLPPTPMRTPGTEPSPDPRHLEELKKNNYFFDEARRLNGNIGYLKLGAFMDPEDGGATVAGAMSFLAHTDALIIDLRQNHGGDPSMVALLASYFFDGEHPVHLNDIAFREEGQANYNLVQSWTLPYVPGQRYLGKEVYVLTSHATFSGAEEFSYDLQAQKHATIVGEVTGGGANPGDMHRLSEHFSVFVPNGHAINPITKTNWEGVGVKPDIEVSQEQALNVAQKAALEHLMAKASDPRELGSLRYALATLEVQQEGGSQSASPSRLRPEDLNGPWVGQLVDPMGNKHELTLNLKVAGAKISGTISGEPPEGAERPLTNCTFEDDQLSCEYDVHTPDGNTIKHAVKTKTVAGEMKGSIVSQMGTMPFTVARGTSGSSALPEAPDSQSQSSAQMSSAAQPSDFSGTWVGQLVDPMGNKHELTLNLKVTGDKISGSIKGEPPDGAERPLTSGGLKDGGASFEYSAPDPDGRPLKQTVTLKGDKDQMKGSIISQMGTIPFTVKRK